MTAARVRTAKLVAVAGVVVVVAAVVVARKTAYRKSLQP
jgi:hypothetical protein